MSKSSFTSCTSPLFSWDDSSTSELDPYGILQDLDSTVTRDVGPYKNFLHITRTSIDTSLLMECRPNMRKLRFVLPVLRYIIISYAYLVLTTQFSVHIFQGFDARFEECGPHLLDLQTEVGILDQHVQCLYHACTVTIL